MNKLSREDLIDVTLAWVMGMLMQQCMPGCPRYEQFHDSNGKFKHVEFDRFALNVHATVYKYIRGQKTLDDTCSEMECTLSIKAKHTFGWYGS